MADWKAANFKNMIPPSFEDAVTLTSSTVGGVAAILQPVADAMNALAGLIVSAPIFDFASALTVAVNALLEDFNKTGVYALSIIEPGIEDQKRLQSNIPGSAPNGPDVALGYKYFLDSFGDTPAGQAYRDRLTNRFFQNYGSSYTVYDSNDPSKQVGGYIFPSTGGAVDRFKGRVVGSFNDIGDPNRPTFNTEVAGIAFLVAAPTGADYQQLAIQISRIFTNMKEWTTAGDAIVRITTTGFQNKKDVKAQYSTPPDWTQWSFSDIFPAFFEAINNFMLPITQGLTAGANAGKALEFFADVIVRKINTLVVLLEELEVLLADLDDALSATGIYAVYVESSTGVDGWAKDFFNATLPPELEALNRQDAVVGGMVFMAGSSLLLPFSAFFGGVAA
jgi:hypothetical protein